MFVIKAIIPKKAKIVNPAVFEQKVKQVLTQAENDIKREFRKTVSTWRYKPPFTSKRKILANTWTSDIGPHGRGEKLYAWLDLGTAPHRIVPVHAPALVFLRGYQPRTTPRVIGSGAQRRFPPRVVTQEVHHPGIRRREFSDTIGTQYAPIFYSNLSRAFSIAASSFHE